MLRGNNRLFWGMAILGFIVTVSLAAPLLTPLDPDAVSSPASLSYQPPSFEHWFGTDQFGRDVFVRLLFGGRVSLLLALSVVSLSAIIGALYGAISGFSCNKIDNAMMRLLDIFLSFPVIFLVIACLAVFGNGLLVLVLVLAFTGWMDIARLVRGEVHSLRRRPFILRAQASGLSSARIVLTHLLPNTLATLLAAVIIRTTDIILIESALSFLGLGVQPPKASWGTIISEARPVLDSAWWLAAFPALAIAITVYGLNIIADEIRP